MRVRVGIDLDNNGWIDWEGNNPPNLIPNPLWLNAAAYATEFLTKDDRIEITEYGMTVLGLSSSKNDGATSLTLFTGAPHVPVEPVTTYNVVVWGRDVDRTSPLFVLEVLDQSGALVKSSTPFHLPVNWAKVTLEFTTNLTVTGIQVRLATVVNGVIWTPYTVELTGVGVYKGSIAPDFNSGFGGGVSEDVSEYVLSLGGDSGSTADVTNMTPIDGQLEILLDNSGQEWTPRNPESPFYNRLLPQTLVEVQYSADDAVWEPLWVGFYDSRTLVAGTGRNQQATLKASQGLLYMGNQRTTYVPEGARYAHEIVTDIMQRVLIPANRSTWRLGASQLGVSTAFSDPDAYLLLDTTGYLYPVAGAGIDGDTSLRDFLNALIINEGGFGFYDRQGRFVFRKRDSLFPSIFDIP